MRKLVIAGLLAAVAFSGCATGKIYNTTKAVYKGGKVIAQNIPIKDEKRAKLKKLDKYATGYDNIRTKVRVGLGVDSKQTNTNSQ